MHEPCPFRFPLLPVALRQGDGEVIVVDRHKVSRFQLSQQVRSTHHAVFDCLYCNGMDLRRKPLEERRRTLEDLLPKQGEIFASRRLASNGFKAFRVAEERGFEGIVAKDNSSPYIERRSKSWLKVKVHQEEEFVIGGFTRPGGSRRSSYAPSRVVSCHLSNRGTPAGVLSLVHSWNAICATSFGATNTAPRARGGSAKAGMG